MARRERRKPADPPSATVRLTVWVVGEGPRDHGTEDRAGAVGQIAERVLALGGSARFVPRRTTIRKHGGFGRAPSDRLTASVCSRHAGDAHRLALALCDARREGAQAVVFVHDIDVPESRAARVAREARRDLGAARDDVECAGLGVPNAIGVAVPMVEAWLLGDARAFSAAFGSATTSPVPSRPERATTGRGGMVYAKKLLETLLDEVDAQRAAATRADQYALLAVHLDPKAASASCPTSFAPFREELERLAERLRTPET